MSNHALHLDPDVAACDATLAMHAPQALAVLEGLVLRLRQPHKQFQLAYALAMQSRALSMAEQRLAAEQAGQEALALFRQLGNAGGEALALNALGINAYGRGDHARALDCLNQALPLARNAGWPDLNGRIANTLGNTLNDMGHHEQAAQVLEEAWSQTTGDTSPRLRLRLHNNRSLALARWAQHDRDRGLDASVWRPRAERAAQIASEGVDTCRREQPADLALTLDNLAAALLLLDRLEEAHQALDEAEDLFHQIGDAHSLVFTAANRARAWIQAGRWAQAVAAVQGGLSAAEQASVSNHLDELYLLQSQAYEAQGLMAEALLAYKQFHHHRSVSALDAAMQKAQALAVTLQTERAVRESRQDALTGLANRRAFDESLGRLLPRAAPGHAVALAIIDVDSFKQINDRHGHVIGDEALVLVADLLRRHSRETDIAARLGGDEFALLIIGAAGAAQDICGRLREQLTQLCRGRWHDGPKLTLSIGLAETEQPVSSRELMLRADAALYTVKSSGRDGLRMG